MTAVNGRTNWQVVRVCALEVVEEADNGQDIDRAAAWAGSILHMLQDEREERLTASGMEVDNPQ